MDYDYPLSKHDHIVTNTERLREIAPDVATAFRGLREAADAYGPLDAKQIELTLLAGFAATENEGGFRVHCSRAIEAGATLQEIEQVVILLLGTTLGLAPAVQTLGWVHDELK